MTSRQHTRDDLFLPSAQLQSPIPQELTTERSQSDIGSLISEEPMNENEKDEIYLVCFVYRQRLIIEHFDTWQKM